MDGLRRLSGVTAGIVSKNYTYRDISDTQTTTQVTQLNYPNIGTGMGFGYTYDVSGNIATYTAPDGEVITYTYDSQGQLLSAVGDSTYSYTYDAAGNILTANGHTYTYGDSAWKDLLTAFDNGTITYDASGNPTSYYNGTRWTMSWENGRQLISATTDISDTEEMVVEYVYDMNGLRVSKTVTVNTYEAHTHSYTTTVVEPNCTARGYTRYTCACGDSYIDNYVAALGHIYDSLSDKECNRCGYNRNTGGIIITPPDPDYPIIGTGISDVETTSETASDRVLLSTNSEQHDYIYASGKLLREVITTGEGATATTQTLDFFYDANGTPLALKVGNATYYYVTNLQGDVIQLVDSTGTAVAAYEYDPYGNIVFQSGNLADLNPLRYRGYYYDAETGFYYVSSRYYDPEIGRWISPEPNVYVGGYDEGAGYFGYNVYAYCVNNPIIYKDETGEGVVLACVLIFAGIGAVVGGFYSARTSKAKLGYVNGWWVVGGVLAGGGTGALIGWGVGAAAAAIGTAMTAGSGGTLGTVIYANWQSAEQALRNLMHSASSVASRTFSTPWGNRIVDAFNSSKRIIAEAKYGYQGLSQFIKTEIARDAWLLKTGQVKAVEWHFYVSQITGKGGPSGPLLKALLEAGIKVIFH